MKDFIALLLKAPQLLKLLVAWAPAILKISKELQALSGRKDFESIKGTVLAIIGIVVTAGGWMERETLNLALANLGDIVTALGALWTAAGALWAAFGFRKAVAEAHSTAKAALAAATTGSTNAAPGQ